MENTRKEKDYNHFIRLGYLLLIPQLFLFAFIFYQSYTHINALPSNYIVNASLNCLGIFLVMLMYLSILRSRLIELIDLLLLLFLLLTSVYMFSDGLFWVIDGKPQWYMVNVITNLLYVTVPLFMTLIFWAFLGILIDVPKKRYRRLSVFMIVTASCGLIFIILNLFFGQYYTISPQTGEYSRGSLYVAYLIIPAVLFFICLYYILINPMKVMDKLILISYLIVPYLNTILFAQKIGPSLLTVEIFLAVTFFYTNLYVRRENTLMQRSRALTQSRLNALQMQINPHFFYNPLSSIASLCDTSPEDAQEMIYRLSDYLHDNFSDISRPALISFSDELHHLEHYLSIEQLRFPNITVEYHIETEDFTLPSMTLQPLVENAIKHGICKKRKSIGTITITTRETPRAFVVFIEDDGVGFDSERPSAVSAPEGHIGIENVRTRLDILCGGTLRITSIPGSGTTCRIAIPKSAEAQLPLIH